MVKPRSPKNGNTSSGGGFSNILLALNAVLMIGLIAQLSNGGGNTSIGSNVMDGALLVGQQQQQQQQQELKTEVSAGVTETRKLAASTETSTTASTPVQFTTDSGVRDFLAIAKTTGTDKVLGHAHLKQCVEEGKICLKHKFVREKCRPWGHFYDSFYQRWLAPFSRDDVASFQLLEIGFYEGHGFAAFQEFLPKAEAHSVEISCLNDGQGWNLGNTAKKRRPKLYEQLRAEKRLHCGSAADLNFLDEVWNQQMKRPDGNAPPLKVVVDDASHQVAHMIQTVFYWFPKIEPGGFMIVEDVQPIPEANSFRTQFLPQMMSDLHYCGHPDHPEDSFFPTLWPLLASVSCEMHICIFERNEQPAKLNLPRDKLIPPVYALDYELAIKTVKTAQSLK